MMLLGLNLIWIAYTLIEAFREGFYWFFKANTRKDCQFEIHPIFMIQRGLVMILISCLTWYSYGLCLGIANFISMAMVFSFFHNGGYYLTRNKIDKNTYPLGWKDQSTTSTSKLTKYMTFRNRSILMVVGYALLTFAYLCCN